MAAVSLLLNAESCSRVSGTAEYKSWGKSELIGPPKRVNTVEFVVDNQLGSWSEDAVGYGEGRRYSKDTGQEYVDNGGEVIEYLAGISNWPLLIKMLRPSRFEIWGRIGDKWRPKGAESVDHGYLLHLNRDTSPATAELFIDTTFSLPTRWTEIHPPGPTVGAKREVEIKGLHIPPEWKRLTGMDMSEKGEDLISSMVKDKKDDGLAF
ncbi:hypothetical protein HH308_15570 [Gordonia sp. TBRC 11910]|uniref:Uncharacterized protein n=1 Tax=Gordonia asplenii TaxID=2725283 RepID=A0A848L280_9ACTN|nr:hypothetical protein [Gordonia asplenii]NMO02631.1 hypothetical protein [Gordonia asplenii]